MITGLVTEDLEAILALVLHGETGTSVRIDAVVDTGFNGFLTLPPALVNELKLSWLCRQQGELADGTLTVFDVYEATIDWDGQQRAIEVEAADAAPLLGMALLADHVLRIEVVEAGTVTID